MTTPCNMPKTIYANYKMHDIDQMKAANIYMYISCAIHIYRYYIYLHGLDWVYMAYIYIYIYA